MSEKDIKIGDRIRRLRITKGMAMGEVSQQSGISEQTIDSIESGMLTPPIGNLVSLAKVFDVAVGDFFGDGGDAPYCIVRSDGREAISRFDSASGKPCGYSYESLGSQKKNRNMEPFLVTLSPIESSQIEPNQHVGEEILFVLEGKVEVRLLDRVEILSPGDSIYYDSTMPHVVSCHGDTPAKILAVIYAKEERIIL